MVDQGAQSGVLPCKGQRRSAFAHVYFEEEPGRRSAAKLLTRDEARHIAADMDSEVRSL